MRQFKSHNANSIQTRMTQLNCIKYKKNKDRLKKGGTSNSGILDEWERVSKEDAREKEKQGKREEVHGTTKG